MIKALPRGSILALPTSACITDEAGLLQAAEVQGRPKPLIPSFLRNDGLRIICRIVVSQGYLKDRLVDFLVFQKRSTDECLSFLLPLIPLRAVDCGFS